MTKHDILFPKHFHCESSLDMVVTYEDAKASMNEFAIQCLNEVLKKYKLPKPYPFQENFKVIDYFILSKINELRNEL